MRLGWRNTRKARLDGEHGVPWAGLAGWTVPSPGCSLTPPFLWRSARVTQLIRGFGSSWKASVESLSQDVMRSFTNFRNGTSIIQVTGHPSLCPSPFLSVSLLLPWALHTGPP